MDWSSEPVTKEELIARQEWLDQWETGGNLSQGYFSSEEAMAGLVSETSNDSTGTLTPALTQVHYDEDGEAARQALEVLGEYETVSDIVEAFNLEDFGVEVCHVEYTRRRRARVAPRKPSFWTRFVSLFRRS